jgi:hypothetical protein
VTKKNNHPVPEELAGISLERQVVLAVEVKSLRNRSSDSVTVSTGFSVGFTVEEQGQASGVTVETPFTVSATEKVDGRETALLTCSVKALSFYVLPRANVKLDEIKRYEWFFAYMSYALIRRAVKEALADTEFSGMPVPFTAG